MHTRIHHRPRGKKKKKRDLFYNPRLTGLWVTDRRQPHDKTQMHATRPRVASAATKTAGTLLRSTTTTRRPFSSSHTVPLAFDHHEPPKSDRHRQDAPIIFMHGLFGSKKNNRTVSR